MSGVNWPLVIGSSKMHVNARSKQSLRVSISQPLLLQCDHLKINLCPVSTNFIEVMLLSTLAITCSVLVQTDRKLVSCPIKRYKTI